MSLMFRPAERTNAKPLIGLYAESNCGKTYSALLLARGFVGPSGRIGMIETESGRGEAYAATIPGGYDVLSIRDNFSPKAYGDAISAAEKANLDALIIDSASHEWEGTGGVLDMAATNMASGKKGVLAWQQPKMDHSRFFMLRLLASPIPIIIVCMRAKYPMREVGKPGGGKEWVRSEVLEPKQSDDILFEMATHGWIDHEHRLHVTRYQLPDLKDVIRDGEPITVETGARLAAWARNEAGANAPRETPLQAAEKAAGEGTEALRRWWSGEGRAHQKALAGDLERLKSMASMADEPEIAPEPPSARPSPSVNEARRDQIMAKLDEAGDDGAAIDSVIRTMGGVLKKMSEEAPDLYDEVMKSAQERKRW